MTPKEISIFKIHTNSIKIMNGLILNFSHLNEHKFRHNFRATIDHMCSYGLEQETTLPYLLHCNLYSDLNDVCVLNPTMKCHEKLFGIMRVLISIYLSK